MEKEILLHLETGEVVSITLCEAKEIDMGNGHLFVTGVVREAGDFVDPPLLPPSLEQMLPWKL